VTYDLGTSFPGILVHHDDRCPARLGRPCRCGPLGYRGFAEDADGSDPVLGPPLDSIVAARAWTNEHQAAVSSWRAATSQGDTVEEVVSQFLNAARGGRALDANGAAYDPSALADLEWSLRGYVATELGAMPIARVTGAELRRVIRRLDEAGLAAARTRSVVAAMRALLRYAAQRGLVPWSAADTLIVGEEPEAPRVTAPLTAAHPPVPPTLQTAVAGAEQSPSRTVPGMVPDEVIWMMLKVVSIVFVLIALVLVAESV
jgi:integrase-like protein